MQIKYYFIRRLFNDLTVASVLSFPSLGPFLEHKLLCALRLVSWPYTALCLQPLV
jgi:hypothetical protein